ncbi:MAG TPA: AAA family ATPase [Micromonosporaceae bacterium]
MSSSHPRHTRSEPVHRQVARNIRTAIEAGVLRHGDVLPSTRELAEQWNTSVFTISEAMKVLAGEGLVVSKSRSKRVVHVPEQMPRSEVRLRKPQVILIGGHVGSGKSELGRILARETGWPILDKDTITRPVVEAALEMLHLSPHDRESSTYVKTIRPREYEALRAATEENVACGNSAIVTAPFLREFNDRAWIDRTQATLSDLDAKTTYVWVSCDAETMHSYVRHRGAARDAAKLADWAAYLASIDVDFRPPVPHFLIDNSASSKPLQNQAKDLLAAVLDEDR